METFRTLIGPDTGDTTVAQLCVRAAILFLFGIACIRIAGRRTFSQITPLESSWPSSSARTSAGR
jgi:hypothetical protein